jgi:hypothetical protein
MLNRKYVPYKSYTVVSPDLSSISHRTVVRLGSEFNENCFAVVVSGTHGFPTGEPYNLLLLGTD